MIDLKDFRKDNEKYRVGAEQKWVSIDWDTFIATDEKVRHLQVEMDALKAKKNELSAQVWKMIDKSSEEFKGIVSQVWEVKKSLADLEESYLHEYSIFENILHKIPSPAISYSWEKLIVGTSDEQNQVLPLWDDSWFIGEKPDFWFTPKPHREILEAKWLIDQERAVKLSWARFQIMRGQFAQLQFALMQRVSNKLINKWFELTLVPQMVKEEALFATWYLPNDSKNLYKVNPEIKMKDEVVEAIDIINKMDEFQDSQEKNKILESLWTFLLKNDWEHDDLRLIGTAEVPLIAQHANEIFDTDHLPLRYVGFSSCYRREAGTYGKDTKWLIRLHQFEKIEMVSFVRPEDSEKEHIMLRKIEEEIFSDLWIPFQRINICTWDLGAPAAKKYDLEAWFPGINMYKEVTSTSNTTDYQTRRANIKFKDDKSKQFVHSLNGTAVALWRALAAIVENYQTEEWDVLVPEVLKSFVNFEKF